MIRKKLNAEKLCGKDFIIECKPEKVEAYKKEKYYPFNIVTVRVQWDNRSQCNVKLKEIFLRIFVDNAPLRYIFWNKREKDVNIELDNLEREFDVYGAKDLVFHKNTKGFLDIYIYIPQYIDISYDTYISYYIDIVGYAVFDSPFGEFTKKIYIREIKIKPDMWR